MPHPRSLDDDAVVTLVHVFVVSRVVYCLGLLADAPTSCNVSLTQPLESCRTAASTTVDSPISGDMFYTGSTSHKIRNVRPGVQISAQHSMAPGYLAELCRPVSSIDGHQHLQSARRGQFDVPRVRLSTYGGHAFCHAGPSAWNAFPVCLKNNALSLTLGTSSNISTSRPTNTARSWFFTINALIKRGVT